MILYIFSFLAGLATVLSPCVLPVLPAILSGGVNKGKYRPLGIVLGLISSFVFFTLTLTYLVHLLGISANILRYFAIGIISLFGLIMIFPSLSDKFSRLTSSVGDTGANLQSKAAQEKGFISGFILGMALGLVWTPCAGPILAAITTLVATQSITSEVILLTLAYSLGAAIPLFLIAYGGNLAIRSLPFLKKHTEGIRKIFGFLMIAAAIGLLFNFEVYFQKLAIEYFPTLNIENNAQVKQELDQLRPSSPYSEEKVALLRVEQMTNLPNIGPAPEIVGINSWINSNPLKIVDLKGKVVLIDFWTYSCINCIRTLPYITDWYQKYKDLGFVVIGVHTPEFEFEKNYDNVLKATKRFNVTYPVPLDNDYQTWQAYHNQYWPAHYLIDQQGNIRDVHFGEGAYLETENNIRALLGLSKITSSNKEEQSQRILTPETYLGFSRGRSYAMKVEPEKIVDYQFKTPLPLNGVGLKGKWLLEEERVVSKSPESSLSLRFIATRVYLVMDSKKQSQIKVLLDGQPLPPKYYTEDMDEKGNIVVQDARKYDVINLKGDYAPHEITLIFPEEVAAYAFTFGDEN